MSDLPVAVDRKHFNISLKTSWPWLLLILEIIAAGFAVGHSFLEGDTLWHIKNGLWILQHHAVPHTDYFSWTAYGKPWTAHEWLWDVLAGLSYTAAGKWGLWLLTLIGITLFGSALWMIIRRIATSKMALLLIGLVFTVVSPFWCARPHVMSTGLLAMWIAVLILSHERPKLLFWLLPVAIFWANIHSSVLLGPVLIVVALVAAFFDRASRQYIKMLASVFIGCLVAVCLSPQGINIYNYVLKIAASSTMLNNIVEWQSPNFHQPYMYPFLIVSAIIFCLFILRPRPVPVFHGFLLIITFCMALLQARNAPIYYFTAAILIADLLPWEPKKEPKFLLPLMLVVILGLTALAWPFNISWTESPREGLPTPERAVMFLENNGYTDHIFNNYAWGGYLIFNNIRPFVDGRADMYVLSGTHVFQDYLAIFSGNQENPSNILKKYNVKVILISPYGQLRWYLEQTPEWKMAYLDNGAVIFIRKDVLK